MEDVAQYFELGRAHVVRHVVRAVERVPEHDLRARRVQLPRARLAVHDAHFLALERELGVEEKEPEQQRFCRIERVTSLHSLITSIVIFGETIILYDSSI